MTTPNDDSKRQKDDSLRNEALIWLDDVARFALSLTRNESDADDLVQDTFLRAYRSWGSYIQGTECRGWLFTICRNQFLRTMERSNREVTSETAELEALAAAALHASAVHGGHGDLFEAVDLSEAIVNAIDRLPHAFKEVIILVDVQDQPYESAARVLGVPVGTVRSRLFRGRRLLQESLLEHARDAGLVAPPTRGNHEDTTL
jgi:RNA polymerase sigma-70 factor (ECF subfamily)